MNYQNNCRITFDWPVHLSYVVEKLDFLINSLVCTVKDIFTGANLCETLVHASEENFARLKFTTMVVNNI